MTLFLPSNVLNTKNKDLGYGFNCLNNICMKKMCEFTHYNTMHYTSEYHASPEESIMLPVERPFFKVRGWSLCNCSRTELSSLFQRDKSKGTNIFRHLMDVFLRKPLSQRSCWWSFVQKLITVNWTACLGTRMHPWWSHNSICQRDNPRSLIHHYIFP